MSNKKDGGPAYPRTMWTGNDQNRSHRDVPGMTLRDYFAGQALTGIISGIKNAQDIRNNYHHAADEAYGYADAMLAEREK